MSAANIIDLEAYRARKSASRLADVLPAMPAMAPVFWMPVWILMPVYVQVAAGHGQSA